MNKLLLLVSLLSSQLFFSQNKELSSVSEFIDRSSYVQINMDANEKAIFKSGLGETVTFYPAEIIDLKTNEKMLGLTVESLFNVGQQGMTQINGLETAWIGMEEIGDMIIWLENYIIPNLQTDAGKNRTVKYIFNTKEITLKFEIYNTKQVFSVILNNTYYHDKYFWTESKVKEIPNVLAVLKYLQAKK
ncbi:hypothetical protein [Flavobacterium cerinum]|uniref:Uncharacterized protein n=1 Tax=Flavobacterium cerinum TaxID=2502784 RepID=A0A3S4T358_9FLAO|nr:hypothetical protein [Flavobacterium cerinum]RWX02464.1 hypothetical protein EPI11_04395 [Flavobacterium cerinum]